MIAKLRGRVDSTGNDWAVIEAGGVGYLVSCTSRTLQSLEEATGEVDVRIHTVMRDSSLQLFGFRDSSEQQWFRLLIGVQGVGPRIALAMLEASPVSDLARAIAGEDVAVVSQGVGVGRKLASRIITELRDKAESLAIPARTDHRFDDSLAALVALGYGRDDARQVLTDVHARSGGASAEDLVRESVQILAVR